MLAGAGLYGLGYWQGAATSAPIAAGVAAPAAVPAPREPLVESTRHGFDDLLHRGAWFGLERWLTEHRHSVNQAHGAALVKSMSPRINKYDAVAMRSVLRAYLDAVPADHAAWFLLSDLQQLGGMREAALQSLFTILDAPFDPTVAEHARRQADQIVHVIDVELRTRGAIAEREALWRHLTQRLPSSDRYRYEWARALADLQRWGEALRVLDETGSSDVAQETIDDLRGRVELAEHGLQFERDGEKLLSTAQVPGGVSLTLLVDTGANVTSLSKRALRSVAAVRLNEQARIRTAGGIVDTGVFEVSELEVQGHRFSNLRVIELPVDLPGLDGLLGLDVLNQLSVDFLGSDPG